MLRPQELQSVQRRAAYRARVGPDDLSVRVWRIGLDTRLAESPAESQQIGVEARDISLGGLGLLVRSLHGRAALIMPGERLRIELAGEEGRILLEGHFRGARLSNEPNTLLAGVQWHFPDDKLQARQITAFLEKLINRLQRQELRRARFTRGRGH
jgi:hypothetical protein